ncbi:MAG: 3-keto-5-aminohexanoate cleavage protein [Armatimonadia bacterium]
MASERVLPDVFIINACLTGMVPTRADTPYVPLTVEEIAADAAAALEAGAAIVHLHPRDETTGLPSTDPDLYRRLIAAVRESAPDLLISATCSGRLARSVDERAVALDLEGDLRPDLGSLTCGSLNFPKQASVNEPETIAELARRMLDRGIKAEVEVFEPGMANTARYLVRKGLLEEPLYVNILLGNLGTCPAGGCDLAWMVNSLPEGTIWSAAGIGRYQLPVNAMALAMGGNIRVGLEDNIHYDWQDRSLATNCGLIERMVRVGAELGRRPATPDEAREIIGLPVRALCPA